VEIAAFFRFSVVWGKSGQKRQKPATPGKNRPKRPNVA
jgi:hypothetical protein